MQRHPRWFRGREPQLHTSSVQLDRQELIRHPAKIRDEPLPFALRAAGTDGPDVNIAD